MYMIYMYIYRCILWGRGRAPRVSTTPKNDVLTVRGCFLQGLGEVRGLCLDDDWGGLWDMLGKFWDGCFEMFR